MAVFVPALRLDPKGPRDAMEAIARKASPITCVNAKFPPTLLVHGDQDKIVPLQQSQAMDRALTEAGVEHELEIAAGCDHDETTFGNGLNASLDWFKSRLVK